MMPLLPPGGPAGNLPAPDEAASRAQWRERRFREELLTRASLSLLILGFSELSALLGDPSAANAATRIATLSELFLNGPYYLAARTGRWPRAQAYARMLGDIAFVTLGLYGAGGLAAAHYLGVYAIIAVYAGIVFSSAACLAATASATAAYLAVALAQHAGWLPAPAIPPNAWVVAWFNLLVLNLVAGLTGLLSEAYRQSRRRIRETEARFRALTESASDAIIAADSRGRLVSWNRGAEAMFGYAAAEALGASVVLLLPERYQAFYRAGGERFAAQEVAGMLGKTVERLARARDGREFPVEVSLASWRTEAGEFWSGIVRDISVRKRVEEELRQSQKMDAVGRLAGGVAHDFNNLLTAVMAYGQLMLWELAEGDRLRDRVERIMKTAFRAATLTRQLLAFSRSQVLEPRILDPNGVITELEDLIRRLIGGDIELVTLLDPALGRVKADPGQLEQVLVNLAANARDAMPRGGRLTIETANAEIDEAQARELVNGQPGSHVMVAVGDTGCGMDEETRSRIFEPFFTTKEAGKGTGLGLSTAYGIVKQSHGSIGVRSAPGRGATFQIYLPRVEDAVEPAAGARPSALELRGAETILLVEDDPEVLAAASEVLQRSGYTVLEARDPGEAVALCGRHPGRIHLLLTDVVMPEVSGRELAERRLAPLRPEMKVLYMSGYTDSAVVHGGVVEPGLAFLPKPFTADSLARKVREVLDGPGAGSQPRPWDPWPVEAGARPPGGRG